MTIDQILLSQIKDRIQRHKEEFCIDYYNYSHLNEQILEDLNWLVEKLAAKLANE